MKRTIFLTFLWVGNIAQAELSVHILPRVEVESQQHIVLGDIARFEGFSEKEISEIKNARLSDAPLPGESRVFSSSAISSLYRVYLKNLEEKKNQKITFRVPQKVIVTRKPNSLDRAAIEKEMLEQLRQRCTDCQFELQGLNMPILSEPLAQGASWSLKMPTDILRGSFNVPVEIRNVDSTRRLYWISGYVMIRREVPVAKRILNMGERLLENDHAMELKDITFVTDAIPGQLELRASLLARPVAAGQVITKSHLRREAGLQNGDIVRVVAGSESWQISADGVAQQSAYIGDTVKIKIPRTQKIISGLLIEKGLVEVRQ